MSKSLTPRLGRTRDIGAVVDYMKSEECRKICIMAGAGISTSAGIPDFRSPDTGLYANLERLNLPYPEAVFDIGFFRKNPQPFYTLARELAPGKYRPTPTHSFIRLLAEKDLLHFCFTQNIDTLERRAGVPPEKLVEAHGSFASHACIECGASYPSDEMHRAIEEQNIPTCNLCMGLVKPNIVFFGEPLPENFVRSLPELHSADLLIILGTSLTVYPFASLTGIVREDCPRVLINLDAVGSIGSRPDDVVLLGNCDDVVRKLCDKLGWREELESLWGQTKIPEDEDREEADSGNGENGEAGLQTDDDVLAEKVEALTEEIGKTLRLSENHREKVEEELGLDGKDVNEGPETLPPNFEKK